ncbi:sensor histidine kinase [Microlunatus elymi]|nr:sensor histidine kinase [Microlunatus elymi]
MPNFFRMALTVAPQDMDRSNAAPTAYCGPDPAPRFSLRRAVQNMAVVYIFGLFFMVFTISDIAHDAPTTEVLVFRVALVVLIALTYVGSAFAADGPLWFRWAYIGWFIALTMLTIPFNGWDFLDFGVYTAIMLAALIPWRTARWAIVIWSCIVAAGAIPAWEVTQLLIGVMSLLIGGSVGGGIQAGRIRARLDLAEQRVSALAVAAERERIARDLHDILGHSLTAISIKSGLAARLAEQDPAAAKAQMTEVEEIARVALADVRSTTTGMRQVRLASEIASARSVLMAAGIEAVTPSALPTLSAECSELLGYVVREAVTNVVRHADATRCVISVADHAVSVADDGVGIDGRRGGSGLAGLSKRVGEAGGRFSVTAAPSGGTVVHAEWSSTKINNKSVRPDAAAGARSAAEVSAAPSTGSQPYEREGSAPSTGSGPFVGEIPELDHSSQIPELVEGHSRAGKAR